MIGVFPKENISHKLKREKPWKNEGGDSGDSSLDQWIASFPGRLCGPGEKHSTGSFSQTSEGTHPVKTLPLSVRINKSLFKQSTLWLWLLQEANTCKEFIPIECNR